MNILIAGCGTVGSRLATKLSEQGHVVCVIDIDASNFEKLPPSFDGFTVAGNGIDLDLLRKAGIEGCDTVVAATSSDNLNVMISQLAQEVFGIKQVLTRIYDADRADIFSRFNLTTVCPTTLTMQACLDAIYGGVEQ